VEPVNDAGGLGANGRAILRGSVPRLIVEIDTQDGTSADGGAIDHLLATLGSIADKQGIDLAGGNSFSSNVDIWTTDDLKAVAADNREQFSGPDAVVIYIVYVHGQFGEGGVLGVAHSASEIGLFPDEWSGLGGLLGSDAAIERSVVLHEVGHLLGLVNLSYESEIAHEDPEHDGHSANEDSVMHWAIDSTLIGQIFSGPPPDEFDADDLADIEGLRTGRY